MVLPAAVQVPQPLFSQSLFSPTHTPLFHLMAGKILLCFEVTGNENKNTLLLLSPVSWQVSSFFAAAMSIITCILPMWRPECSEQQAVSQDMQWTGRKAGGTQSLHLQVVMMLCILSERFHFFAKVLQVEASKSSPGHHLGDFLQRFRPHFLPCGRHVVCSAANVTP